MATTIFACGFECGVLGANGEHWAGNNTPTISTSVVRSGARSLRCAASGNNVSATHTISTNLIVVSAFVNFDTLASTETAIVTARDGTGGSVPFGLWYTPSDGNVRLSYGSGGAAAGVTATAGWHLVDIRVNSSANPWTCEGYYDGVALDGVSQGRTAATLTQILLAQNSGVHTYTYYFDDVAASVTTGDFPLGAGYVHAYVPTADGTHNIAGTGDFQRGNSGTDILNSTTTANALIAKTPLPSGAVDEANNIRAVAPVNATDYTEWVFGPASGVPTPVLPPRSVEVICAHHQIATTAGSMRVAINDNGTIDDVLTITGAAGVTTYRYASKHYADPPSAATAWTLAAGNGTFPPRGRFFSADANPDQCVDAVMIEAYFTYYKPRPPLIIKQAVNRASTY